MNPTASALAPAALARLVGAALLLAAGTLHAQSAVDERAIIAVAGALDNAVDAKHWERARGLFLDQVTVELPDVEPTVLPADELVGRWRERLHEDKASFHLRGNEVVTFDGADSAVLVSKAYAWQRVAGLAGDEFYEVWGDYLYELDRVEGGWRIRRYVFAPRLERGNLAVRDHRLPPPPKEKDGGADGSSDGGDGDRAPDGG